MELTREQVRRRLRRVGMVVVDTADGAVITVDPRPRPVVDAWTVARFGLWTAAGAVGVPRGTAYLCSSVWEILEVYFARSATETTANKIADLVAGVGGYELGRRARRRGRR